MSSSANALLFSTLGLVVLSFFCATYTTLRTLLPLLPPHPLNRRTTGSAVGPYGAPPSISRKRQRLKSAQRFTVWLAGVDIIAAVVLVWEAAFAVSTGKGFGGTNGGASRVYISCTARPTLLLVVAVLSYANVVQGRSIALGALDWIVWGPALILLAIGAGLASLPAPGTTRIWIGLIAWETVVTAIVTLCFGRLLVAILRVRRWTQTSAQNLAGQQERSFSQYSTPRKQLASFLPPIHNNFSGLSTSFISTIGTANSHNNDSCDSSRSSENLPSFVASHAPAVGYAPSRPSADEDLRDARSPTPGSTHGLLISTKHANELYNNSNYSETPKARYPSGYNSHHSISFEELPRPSISSNLTASSYAHAGGLIGSTATRQAISQDVWGTTPPPGSGGSKVQLSQREARGALIRIGGHLTSCLLHFALTSPFLFLRRFDPSSPPPLLPSILLVIAITQPAVVLAAQYWLSEGFWFAHKEIPVLTSSSAVSLEQHPDMEELPTSANSRITFARGGASPVPGIPTDIVDCSETQKGRFGRVLSMIETHPKLQVLPSHNTRATASGAKTSRSSGHIRLRSLTLAKTSVPSTHRQRSMSTASRATLAGFEHHSVNGTPNSHQTVQPSHRTREFVLSPANQKPTHFDTKPVDHSIDFLSSQLLPHLVPSIKFGGGTVVQPPTGALNPRRSSVGQAATVGHAPRSHTALGFSTNPSRPNRNYRNLSLPGVFHSSTFNTFAANPERAKDAETWVQINEGKKSSAVLPSESPFALITEVVKTGGGTSRAEQRRSMGRTSRTWDRVEAEEKQAGHHSGRTVDFDDPNDADDEDIAPPAPQPHSGRRCDLSLADDEQEEQEELEERSHVVDYSDTELARADFDASVNERARSASPLFNIPSPKSPFWDPHVPTASVSTESFAPTAPLRWTSNPPKEEQVVHKGSRVLDDEELGVIQCATVRPVSRNSNTGLLSPRTPLTPGVDYVLRPTHQDNPSISSARSLDSTASSITSVGFRNMLSSNTWHGSDSGQSSADEQSSGNENSAIPRRRSGLRPLSLLGQVDLNASRNSSSDKDLVSKARPARPRSSDSLSSVRSGTKNQPRRSSSSLAMAMAEAPVPDTIDEVDEDKRSGTSGTPTPRASRRKPPASAESIAKYMPHFEGSIPMPMTSTPPPQTKKSVTPPSTFVNVRRGRSRRPAGDENVAPVVKERDVVQPPRPTTRSATRGLR